MDPHTNQLTPIRQPSLHSRGGFFDAKNKEKNMAPAPTIAETLTQDMAAVAARVDALATQINEI